MKASEAIERSLRDIGVLGVGQTLPGAYADDSLVYLQDMMNSWEIELGLKLYFRRTPQALTSGTRDYTIGAGATINIVRPQRIEYAAFVEDSTVTTPRERPIAVYTDQRWASIRQKTLAGPAIEGVYLDRGTFASAVQGTISTYPTINKTNTQIVLYTLANVPASVFADLSTDYVFPPGVAEAIKYNLARRLCRPMGRPLTEDLRDDADRTLTALKRANHQPKELSLDPVLTGRGWFDPESGTYR